jgi:hypothetical protein
MRIQASSITIKEKLTDDDVERMSGKMEELSSVFAAEVWLQ